MKPIIRWTIGNIVSNSGYEILQSSIKSILNLYSDKFDYFVCYNDVDKNKIQSIKNKFNNVTFIKQKWQDCPITLSIPNKIDNVTNQKLNGSFWKICPPRLRLNTHELILDNDLIFLKKPKIIEEFLSSNKNLIIKDSNIYLGSYTKLFVNEKQGYNSGVIGLSPGYDFSKDIIENFKLISYKDELDYGEEQGLLTYCLFKTNPLIGSAEDFVGIHPRIVFLNSLSKKFSNQIALEKIKDTNKDRFIRLNKNILKKIFSQAEVVHFLRSNKENHFPWSFYKTMKKNFI